MVNLDNIDKKLQSAAAVPSTLQEARTARSHMLDTHTDAVPSEKNLLSLLTFKQALKNVGNNPAKGLDRIVKNETKYLQKAMDILTSNSQEVVYAGGNWADYKRIQDKYGQNTAGAMALAELLQEQEEENEFKRLVGSVNGNEMNINYVLDRDGRGVFRYGPSQL